MLPIRRVEWQSELLNTTGLIHQVTEDDDLMSTTRSVAIRFAEGPTRAFALLKRALRESGSSPLSEALQLERSLQREAGLTRDFAEGAAAMREKRKPRFSGD
jgi:2-(1,2-epoxy-1,2-dihydrophenyl)acetyl-CoA isomerase